jgi:hypothetical protein
MAARTVALFLPGDGQFKTTTFPGPGISSDASGARPYLAFDAAADEAVYFEWLALQGITTPLTAVVTYAMASATSGNIIWDVAVECITDGDALDTDASESLDTANASSATAVPGTAGYIDQISITLTNNDSVTAGDMVRFRLRRNGSSGSDTATGDAIFLRLEIRDDGA